MIFLSQTLMFKGFPRSANPDCFSKEPKQLGRAQKHHAWCDGTAIRVKGNPGRSSLARRLEPRKMGDLKIAMGPVNCDLMVI